VEGLIEWGEDLRKDLLEIEISGKGEKSKAVYEFGWKRSV